MAQLTQAEIEEISHELCANGQGSNYRMSGVTRSSISRPIATTSPSAIQDTNIEDPPYETNGRGTPVTGIIPRFIPIFSKV